MAREVCAGDNANGHEGTGKKERMVALVCKCSPTVKLCISFCSSCSSKINLIKNPPDPYAHTGKSVGKTFEIPFHELPRISSCSTAGKEDVKS